MRKEYDNSDRLTFLVAMAVGLLILAPMVDWKVTAGLALGTLVGLALA